MNGNAPITENLKVLEMLIRDLNSYAELVDKISKTIYKNSENLKFYWDDPQYSQFMRFVTDLCEYLNKEISSFTDVSKYLDKKLKELKNNGN